MTTRGELILQQARRALEPNSCGVVGAAVAEYARVANESELELMERALQIARAKMDAYLGGKVVPIRAVRGPR